MTLGKGRLTLPNCCLSSTTSCATLHECEWLENVRIIRYRDHTLQTTALVHEAYLRLVDQSQVSEWDNSGHFFAAAAEAMRRILVEHARQKLGKQQGGDRVRVEFGRDFESKSQSPEMVLAISEALEKVAEQDSQSAELLKLHCFAGFSVVDSAKLLGISKSSAYQHWNFAKALMGQLLE
jgi:RNA polymerase sigma factor (TIGR02999 family)